MTMLPSHNPIASCHLIGKPGVSKLVSCLLVIVILGMVDSSIEIPNRRIRSERVMLDDMLTQVAEARDTIDCFLVSGGSVLVVAVPSVRNYMSFSGGMRHDKEEGDGDEEKSKEISSEGDFKRRHWRTPTKVPLILSNHITPL